MTGYAFGQPDLPGCWALVARPFPEHPASQLDDGRTVAPNERLQAARGSVRMIFNSQKITQKSAVSTTRATTAPTLFPNSASTR